MGPSHSRRAARPTGQSTWEQIGERLGYALASVLLGPHERALRRRMRQAMLAWCPSHMPLTAPRGTVRVQSSVSVATGTTPVDITLDLAERQVELIMAIDSLPAQVDLLIVKGRGHRGLAGIDARGAYRLLVAIPDPQVAVPLLDALAAGSLAGLDELELGVHEGCVELKTSAPETVEAWEPIGAALHALEAWVRSHWSPSYRQ